TAAGAAVFLRRVLAARHPAAPLSHRQQLVGELRGEGGGAAQRHAPGRRDRRVDAHPARRARRRLGARVGNRHAHLRVHQPHAAARSPGKMGRAAVRARAAAAPPDHFRDQRPPHARGRAALAGRHRAEAHLLPDRGERRQGGPDGQPRRRRRARGQRRGGAAHRAVEEGAFPRVRRALPGQIPEQDQRHHAAALAAEEQPAAGRPDHGQAREQRLGPRPRPAARPRKIRRRRGVPARVHGDQAGEQGRPGRRHPRRVRHRGLARRAVRRPDQAAARVQAAAPEPAARPRALSPAGAAAGPRRRAARLRLRRQGRPGYDLAKNIIRAINVIGARINSDARLQGKLKVAFLPNYRVSLAEKIIPAADLSEQISTAGKEASGTGNMKLALNGALTIGTLDGANVEIREEVGDENIFIFGLTVDEVEALRARGYNPWEFYHHDEELRAAVDWLGSDFFTPGEHGSFHAVHNSLLEHDHFMVAADFDPYWDTQRKIDEIWKHPAAWWRAAILNTARMGWFSSDRAIREYADEIWQVPLPDR